jgi:hypothetical protein
LPEAYLEYQQHNVISKADVQRATGLIPRLSKALDPAHGSWDHPLLPIHRAVIFFCQGYSVTPTTSNQFLWAAGLDCLLASKLDRNKQGSPEIARRMGVLLGSTLKLYEADTVSIPVHQTTRTHMELGNVSRDIFKLRNAFAHGLPIPNMAWLSAIWQPREPNLQRSASASITTSTAPEPNPNHRSVSSLATGREKPGPTNRMLSLARRK